METLPIPFFYSATLLDLFVTPNSVLVEYLGFPINDVCVETVLLIIIPFGWFSCPTSLNCKSGHLLLVLDFRKKNFPLFTTEYDISCGLVINCLNKGYVEVHSLKYTIQRDADTHLLEWLRSRILTPNAYENVKQW